MALGDLVKRIFVAVKVDGAEEAKLQIREVGHDADEVAKTYELNMKVDGDKSGRLALDALRLELRALEADSKTSDSAFQNLANRFKAVGDQADGARLKTAAYGLELRAIKDLSQGDSGGGGGGSSGILGKLFGGLTGGGSNGIGSGIPFVGGALGAVGPVIGIPAIVAAATSLLFVIQQLVTGIAAAAQGIAAFGALAYPTFARIITAAGLTGDKLKDLPVGMRHAAEGVQNLAGEFDTLASKFRPDAFKLFNIGLKIAGQILQDLPPFATAAFKAIDPLLSMFNKWLGGKQAQQLQNMFLGLTGPSITALGKGLGNIALALTTLFSKLTPWDIAHTINIVADTIAALIRSLGWLLREARTVWDWLSRTFGPGLDLTGQGFARLARDIRTAWDSVERVLGPGLRLVGEGVMRFAEDFRTYFNKIPVAALAVSRAVAQMGQGLRSEFDTIIRYVEDWYNAVVRYGNDVITWFKNLPSTIEHALSGLIGDLFSIGRSAVQGLIKGFESIPLVSTLQSWIGGGIAGVKAALGIKSPSLVMFGIGANITQGLINGLRAHSPSAVMYDIGVSISDRLIDGLSSGDKKADAAARRIAQIITNRIKAAQAYAASVSSSAQQFAGIAGATSGPAFSSYIPAHYNAQGNLVAASGTRPASANTILRNLGMDATRLSRFATAIKQLANRGLDADLISQIVAAGPDQGYQIAEALLHAPGAIQRADRIQNRINAASARLGAAAAASQYGGGNYVININGGLATAHQIALEVEKIIKQLQRHRGGRKVFG